MPSMEVDSVGHKKLNFLNSNREYLEIIPSAENKTIGHLQNIDENEDEIWFLQCPKGTDITQLLNEKIKLPGKTNIGDMEAVAVDATTPEEYAFGYCNKKCRYNLRVLPVRGNIVLRKPLKASEKVTIEEIRERCPKTSRVNIPNPIKIRHPLFGHQFEKNVEVSSRIADKLDAADRNSLEVSAQVRTREELNSSKALSSKRLKKEKENSDKSSTKKKSRKRVANSASETEGASPRKVKKEKIQLEDDIDEISPDLKWLQEL